MSTKIKLARIDKRLLHATVALNWNQFLNANYVVIVDPSYSNDPFIIKVMKLCLPEPMKVKIFSTKELVDFIEKDSSTKRNLMVIFKDLEVAKEAVEAGFKVNEIQMPYPASRIVIKKLSDFFSDKEIKYIRFIQEKGIKLFFQTSPMDNKEYSVFRKE
ncbi:PTS sugar transporter subunit IIB [Clostridium intestinale]|jgi:PTS system mannose-specific IIB component|uniref:PTS system, IIB component n=1 Tax=Clostridium intestinale URNW TaxID=1294142 RepID=U2NJS7_9CLOT|nr:PTS sugar transporter subunit IIB [Clostridium intestinale]ERK29408.1 PTS system, IIB component [Clostridium intestinale URNW]